MSVVRMMISAADIQAKVKQLGHQINAHYAQSDKELVLIGVLRGSVIFMADLCRTIEKPHQLDFMTVSSYGSSTVSSRDVKILKDLDGEIYDKDVLLVEDIIDTGHSLSKVIEMLQTRQPHSIELCTLVSKPSRREIDLAVRFLGFEVEDRFIVGYGLDYNQQYRHLPYIAEIGLLYNSKKKKKIHRLIERYLTKRTEIAQKNHTRQQFTTDKSQCNLAA